VAATFGIDPEPVTGMEQEANIERQLAAMILRILITATGVSRRIAPVEAIQARVRDG
jgi:hypothetical protein